MADNSDVSLSDNQVESQLSSDSGGQTNDSNIESQFTESKIMEGVTRDVYKRQLFVLCHNLYLHIKKNVTQICQ